MSESSHGQSLTGYSAKSINSWVLFSIASLLLFLNTASAQTEDWVWAQSAGGIFNEARGERVVCDNNGHVIVAGTYSCPEITFGGTTL